MRKFAIFCLALLLVAAVATNYEYEEETEYHHKPNCRPKCRRHCRYGKCYKKCRPCHPPKPKPKPKPCKIDCSKVTEEQVLFKLWFTAKGKYCKKHSFPHFHKHLKGIKLPKVCDLDDSGAYYDANTPPYYGVTCKSGKVVEIDWSGLDLDGTITPWVKCLNELKVFDMSDNDLHGTLPDLNDHIMTVDVSDNDLSKVDYKLCGSLAAHDSCKHVDISGNYGIKTPKCLVDDLCQYGIEE
ncbi:hypothetical protein PCE1_004009 [Barthelona sp. PCE]